LQKLDVNGYTRQQVIDQLHYKNGNRNVNFRYELLNNDDVYIDNLGKVECSITCNSLAEIKKTANIRIKRNIADDIDWLNERIKPVFQLTMPNGDVLEWSLGIFLASSPSVQDSNNNTIIRNIQGYDKAQILKEDKFVDRYYIATGTNYIEAITSIINSVGIGKVNIEPTNLTLNTAIEFEIGYSKLTAINEMLVAVNYYSLYFDEQGYAISKPYIEPSNRAVEYEYRTDTMSIIHQGGIKTLDLFNLPNVFVRVYSNPDSTTALKSVYINANASSPLSTVNRERNIVDYKTVDNIADQTTLDAYTRRQATDASQIFGEVEFATALMPMHDINNCIYLEHTGIDIRDIFIENFWSMELRTGAEMQHKARKVVKLF